MPLQQLSYNKGIEGSDMPNPSGWITGGHSVVLGTKNQVPGGWSRLRSHSYVTAVHRTRHGKRWECRSEKKTCSSCPSILQKLSKQHIRLRQNDYALAAPPTKSSASRYILRATMGTPRRSSRHKKRDSDLLAELPDNVTDLGSGQSSATGSDNLLSRVC